MKLYAAPLQGFTEAPWRNLHQEVFGGIDAYYTPFVRMEKGEFRNKDVREIASENNTVSRLIPQLIASTPAELERLAGLFIEKGYKEADINMGCPFPLMTGKHKGSGILPYPAEVEALLKELVHYPELGFSVKMRLGWECADEWRPLLPLLNAAPLRRIVLHPRIGKQQYKGEVDLAAFTAFYEECAHPLVYNGDLLTVEDIREIEQAFIAAARRVKAAGADGVQLHAAHSYLLSRFLDPTFNSRADAYGGDAAGRFRIVAEIVSGIQAACGQLRNKHLSD